MREIIHNKFKNREKQVSKKYLKNCLMEVLGKVNIIEVNEQNVKNIKNIKGKLEELVEEFLTFSLKKLLELKQINYFTEKETIQIQKAIREWGRDNN